MQSYLGYDPGGKRANGVSILTFDRGKVSFRTSLVDSVAAAQEWFSQELAGASPQAIGIDTYLYWSTRPQGWRRADLWLRKRYPSVANSVFSSNSAFGSMAVQGMSFAIRARETWPAAKLMEAHPKVLYFALAKAKYDWPGDMVGWLFEQIGMPLSADVQTEHEWDALLSAWAAFQGMTGNWPRDLAEISSDVVRPAGPISYWWPE